MTAVVGRVAEAAGIDELLDVAGGDSAALILTGAPGIGKTTLWLVALQRARQRGIRVLCTQASASESVLAYAGLADVLAEVDDGSWADLPERQRHALRAAMLSDAPYSTQPVDQRAVGAAFLAVLTRLTGESPILVAIDDLQWLDPSSVAAIAFAARRLHRGVTWLSTARDDPDSAPTDWFQLSRPGAVRRMPLSPLTITELHDMLSARSGTAITRSTMLRINEVAGGNPFYATELAHEIQRRGSGTEVVLPRSLAAVAGARIGRVGHDATAALLAAACQADPTVHRVALVLGVTSQHLIDLLGEAEDEAIITMTGNRIRFTHPLLAHAVQSEAAPAQRRATHRRLAEIVSEPELRARHLALADPAGEAETIEALDAAAAMARNRGAPAAAVELLEHAIRLGATDESRQILLARWLFDSGEPRRARETLEGMIAESAPGPGRARALQQLAMVRVVHDSFAEAAESCTDALSNCADDDGLSVDVMTTLAFAQLNLGTIEVALETAERAVATGSRPGLEDSLGRALGLRAIVRFMNGDGTVEGDLLAMAAIADPDASVPIALRPRMQSTLLRGWSGQFTAARESLAMRAEQCVADGEEGEMMFIDFQLVLFDIWLGDLDSAEITAKGAVARAYEFDGDAASFMASSMAGAVAAYKGSVDEARHHLDAALRAGEGSSYRRMMTWTVAVRGFLELSLGNHAQALAALRPLLPMVDLAPRFSEIIGASFIPDAAEAMIGLGQLDDAELLIGVLESNGARLGRAWMLAVGARCRALASAARGDVAAGVTHARAALEHLGRLDMPFERARTLLTLGRLERRLRHRQPAIAALNEAMTIFEATGTPLWSAQARTELARGTAGRRPSSGLTPTEQRVADCAAGGMTNKDIAANLFIARKTVEVNLSRIYQKLGIHSRIELYHVMNDAERR